MNLLALSFERLRGQGADDASEQKLKACTNKLSADAYGETVSAFANYTQGGLIILKLNEPEKFVPSAANLLSPGCAISCFGYPGTEAQQW